ncbi:MAG TPA: hypothetical protein VIA18_29925, partial [Polyangia bacterium]|jgi:hypothetical protein|nr:hypothetical protein [Polyangia bacterium]
MARVVRVTLFEREVREKLSVAAIEILVERARILSEGKRSAAPTAKARYFGSTMLTVDVATLGELVREPCDARSAARVAELIRDDARVTKRVQKIATREAERLAGGPVRVRAGDVRVRAQGTFVYLDVDVEE